eukprot:g17085.t1
MSKRRKSGRKKIAGGKKLSRLGSVRGEKQEFTVRVRDGGSLESVQTVMGRMASFCTVTILGSQDLDPFARFRSTESPMMPAKVGGTVA